MVGDIGEGKPSGYDHQGAQETTNSVVEEAAWKNRFIMLYSVYVKTNKYCSKNLNYMILLYKIHVFHIS